MIKKCCQCGAKSIPGLKPKQGLCQAHFNLLVHGGSAGAQRLGWGVDGVPSEDEAAKHRAEYARFVLERRAK